MQAYFCVGVKIQTEFFVHRVKEIDFQRKQKGAEKGGDHHIRELCEPYIHRRAIRHMEKGRIIICAAGTGNPYFTTDTAAALRACEIGAKAIFCAKAVDGVYDSDPKTNPNAQKYDEITFDKAIADNLKALDVTAMSMCREYSIPVAVFSKDEPKGILRILDGEKLGTIIK